MVGELAVLFRAPRAATVKARSDCVLLSVDRRSFEACGGRSEGSMARWGEDHGHVRDMILYRFLS